MNILLIVDTFPTPDRNSADVRLSRLIGMLAEVHVVTVVVLGAQRQVERIGDEAARSYQRALEDLGAEVAMRGIDAALDAHRYDIVVFEWHFPALTLLERVRLRQPTARVVVDSVDVVFNRLEAKARISGAAEDVEHARRTRVAELSVYDCSDLVITVTDADAGILRQHVPGVPTFTIPNIHLLEPPVAIADQHRHRLLFIGSYARPGGETNIDAMRWFCVEVLPMIVEQEPLAMLRIVGGPHVPEIDALASPHVEVVGFVPRTRPYLETSGISIAPLRFGGGMKGKVGEAMAYALPVVSTSTGIEGFGLEAGVHALVGDTPRAFADNVISLLRDPSKLESIRMAGYAFVREHYSDAAVRQRLAEFADLIPRLEPKRLSVSRRAVLGAKGLWVRHLAWRLR